MLEIYIACSWARQYSLNLMCLKVSISPTSLKKSLVTTNCITPKYIVFFSKSVSAFYNDSSAWIGLVILEWCVRSSRSIRPIPNHRDQLIPNQRLGQYRSRNERNAIVMCCAKSMKTRKLTISTGAPDINWYNRWVYCVSSYCDIVYRNMYIYRKRTEVIQNKGYIHWHIKGLYFVAPHPQETQINTPVQRVSQILLMRAGF